MNKVKFYEIKLNDFKWYFIKFEDFKIVYVKNLCFFFYETTLYFFIFQSISFLSIKINNYKFLLHEIYQSI